MLMCILKQLIICKSRSPIAQQTGSVCVADVELACRCLCWIHFLISVFSSRTLPLPEWKPSPRRRPARMGVA